MYRRSACLLLFVFCLLHDPAAAEDRRPLVPSSPLAGFRHQEVAKVWPQLQVGDSLRLVREPDNPYDPNAVRVEWRGLKLGYVPRRENGALAWALDNGRAVRARISALREHRYWRKRMEFEAYVD